MHHVRRGVTDRLHPIEDAAVGILGVDPLDHALAASAEVGGQVNDPGRTAPQHPAHLEALVKYNRLGSHRDLTQHHSKPREDAGGLCSQAVFASRRLGSHRCRGKGS
jgi:hypothetical protein